MVRPINTGSRKNYPYRYDKGSGDPIAGLAFQTLRPFSAIDHYGRRDHRADRHNPQWHQDKVIEITKDRDEIRNEVNWAKGICDHYSSQGLGIPRHPRITTSKIEGIGFPLQSPNALFPDFDLLHWETLAISSSIHSKLIRVA